MDYDRAQGPGTLEPGEWVATAGGRVIAHGHDFHEVAQDACQRADDIAFERIPSHQHDAEADCNPLVVIPAFPTGRRAQRAADAAPRIAAHPQQLLR